MPTSPTNKEFDTQDKCELINYFSVVKKDFIGKMAETTLQQRKCIKDNNTPKETSDKIFKYRFINILTIQTTRSLERGIQ